MLASIFDELSPLNRRGAHGTLPGQNDGPAACGLYSSVERFIDAHRTLGYRCAALDPLRISGALDNSLLSMQRFGLRPTDALSPNGDAALGVTDVHALDKRLKAIYSGPLVLDASAVRDDVGRAWLYARMEAVSPPRPELDRALLRRLVQAQAWEQHVARAYPNGKRFSLEGCESLIPLLDALLDAAAAAGVGDVILGMSHRGRVNTLVNVLGMAPADILDYFDPSTEHPERHQDLVYHLGAHRTVETPSGAVSVTLSPNPSHLQSVYPVVVGMTRALQVAQAAREPAAPALAIVLHGDAAFAGQGVVMETLALAQKPGYSVDGTVHVIVNNQVGFTEPNPMDAQRARYCTDITRMVDAPVLRVNADEPAQVVRAARIALDYRARFGADVVIDLIGYRRLGHSEHDLPSLTRPQVVAVTERQRSVVEVHAARLVTNGSATADEVAALLISARADAQAAFSRPADNTAAVEADAPATAGPNGQPPAPVAASLTADDIRSAVAAMTRLPRGFEPHPYTQALIDGWQAMAAGDKPAADWCFAENLAYASVLRAGIGVRISGLDVRRGTFMHRHAVWHDQSANNFSPADEFLPLCELGDGAARFDVVNSVLSEEAVVGFEYGYSVQDQRNLTIWEAQFGDFVNGAQVFLDQYLGAGEEKWGLRSALTLLLPHGYEGIGPEHSNAHLNRFLSLCAADNLRVAYPSTSAQLHHLLRLQATSPARKPLVVMTPKGTLYNDAASHSPVTELTTGSFQPVLADPRAGTPPQAVERVVLCSGKLFYDLQRGRGDPAQAACERVALLRLEQLHPFPRAEVEAALGSYAGLRQLVWAQEETLNQGAWAHLRDELAALCPAGATLGVVSRPNLASGATSSTVVHHREQAALVARALGQSAASAEA